MVGWLGKVFLQDGPARPASPEASSTLRRWRCHVQRFFYRVYASLRIEELFSIIRGGCSLALLPGLCCPERSWAPPPVSESAQLWGVPDGAPECPPLPPQLHVPALDWPLGRRCLPTL